MPDLNPLPANAGGQNTKVRRTARLRGILAAGLLFIVFAWVYAQYIYKPPAKATTAGQVDKTPSQPAAQPYSSSPAGLVLPGASDAGGVDSAIGRQSARMGGAGAPTGGGQSAGNVADAIPKLQQRLLANPKDVDARVKLAVALDSQGNGGNAEDLLRSALQMGQRSPDLYYALGTLYLNHNRTDFAKEEFKIVVMLAPKRLDGHLKLGQTYLYLGRSKEAMEELDKAKKIDPAVPETYLLLAFLFDAPERYPDALKNLNEFITRSKQPGPGYALLSRVYLNMRQYDKSVEAGLKATQLMPEVNTAWYNLGQAYSYRPGDQFVPDAQRAFEKALALTPQWGQAHFELARLFQRQNKLPEAIVHYREAVRLTPSNGKYHYQLGQLLNRQGQAEEGKKELAEAQRLIPLNQKTTQLINKLSANPKAMEPLFELGVVYKKLGDYQQARAVFQSILEKTPGDIKAKEQIQEIARLSATSPTP